MGAVLCAGCIGSCEVCRVCGSAVLSYRQNRIPTLVLRDAIDAHKPQTVQTPLFHNSDECAHTVPNASLLGMWDNLWLQVAAEPNPAMIFNIFDGVFCLTPIVSLVLLRCLRK